MSRYHISYLRDGPPIACDCVIRHDHDIDDDKQVDSSNHHPAHDSRTYNDLINLYVKLVEEGEGYHNVKDKIRLHPSLILDAERFIKSLMQCDETSTWIRLDEWTIAIETHIIVSRFVHDPHDWDHIRTAIELTRYIVESR